MDVITSYCVTAIVAVCGFFLYVKIRPLFYIRGNCWFCNKDCIVPYLYRNSFECPYCQQYNGFLPDGGYNMVIPAQHDEMLNNTVKLANSPTKHVPGKRGNGLCSNCNLVQEMKIRQLSSFVPLNESRYNEELNVFKQHLEEVYGLCAQCESTVNKFLAKQDSWLLNIVRAWRHLHKESLSPKSWIKTSAVWLLRCVVIFVAVALNVANFLYKEEGRYFLPYVDTKEDMCPVPPVALSVVLVTEFYWIMLGMFIQMCLTILSKMKCVDVLCSLSWTLLLVCYSCISVRYVDEMHVRRSCVFLSAVTMLFSITSALLSLCKTDSNNSNIWKTIHNDRDFLQNWNRTRIYGQETPPTVLADIEHKSGIVKDLNSATASCSFQSRLVPDRKSKTSISKVVPSQEANGYYSKNREIGDLEVAFSNMNIDKTINCFHQSESLLKPSKLTNMKNKSQISKNIASWVGGGFWDKRNACQTVVDDTKPFLDTQTLFSTPTHSRSSNETTGYFSSHASPLSSNDSCASVNDVVPGFSKYQLSPLGFSNYQLSPPGRPSCSPPVVFSVPYMSGTYVHTVISHSPEFITQNMFSFPLSPTAVPGFHKYLHNNMPTFQNSSYGMTHTHEKPKRSYYFLFAAYIPCVIVCYELLKYLILTWSESETVHMYDIDTLMKWLRDVFKF